jgi:DNA-binding response OmpR family regulator
VLVVDEEPEILSFFARILDSNGMRALLARTTEQAIGIAKLGYIPIDLVLIDIVLKPYAGEPDLTGMELVDRIRKLRPEIRILFMSANVESAAIRIEFLDRWLRTWSPDSAGGGLIESIRAAAAAPLVHRVGGG